MYVPNICSHEVSIHMNINECKTSRLLILAYWSVYKSDNVLNNKSNTNILKTRFNFR